MSYSKHDTIHVNNPHHIEQVVKTENRNKGQDRKQGGHIQEPNTSGQQGKHEQYSYNKHAQQGNIQNNPFTKKENNLHKPCDKR